MIVGAGITSVLVDFVKNQRRDRVSVVTRAIVFLDGLMYGYSSAFTAFITYGGLAVFVDRVKVSFGSRGDVLDSMTDLEVVGRDRALRGCTQ